MTGLDGDSIEAPLETIESNQVIRALREEISSGLHWYVALLNAIGRWEIPEELINTRFYRYLISDEAFDFMVLAERLCDAVDTLLPQEEKCYFLFKGIIPYTVTQDEFRSRIGDLKYHRYLNFYYGITVEEALHYAVEEEIRKERRGSGLYRDKDNTGEAYRRIYGFNRTALLRRFRKEKDYSQSKSIKLSELKEFTYWLFKYRLKQSDKARVASDTKKGLDWLRSKSNARQTFNHNQSYTFETIDILNW